MTKGMQVCLITRQYPLSILNIDFHAIPGHSDLYSTKHMTSTHMVETILYATNRFTSAANELNHTM